MWARIVQLLLMWSCSCGLAMGHLVAPRRNIIKVHASGFLPFESDLLLPLGILRQLQAQDRASRVLSQQHHQQHHQQQQQQQKMLRRKPPKAKGKVKQQQVRLERAKADAGIQMYNLIDDDGELLLNLRVHHSDTIKPIHGDAVPHSSGHSENYGTPWRPSEWRPTTRAPSIGTSSSPRPLPLHQYLSNSLETQLPSTQQRRMFGARQDWRSGYRP